MGIGDTIRKERKSQNLTAQNLSDKSGIAVKTIYRIETGEIKDPSISSITAIARALKTSIDSLVNDDTDGAMALVRKVVSNVDFQNEDELDDFLKFLDQFERRIWLTRKIKNLQQQKDHIDLENFIHESKG